MSTQKRCARLTALGVFTLLTMSGQAGREEYRRVPTPGWLEVSGGMMGRMEGRWDGPQGVDDRYYLNRLRLKLGLRPARWFRFVVEGQDTRGVDMAGGAASEVSNEFDLRQAWFEFGSQEAGPVVRVGRQELTLADERLIGADNYWDPFGPVFDAVSAAYTRRGWRATAFAGFRAEPRVARPDPVDTLNRMAGLSVRWDAPRWEAVVEPYLLWKRSNEAVSLSGVEGHRDVVSAGARVMGPLAERFDYNVEMAAQRGHVATDGVRAWAGHWELGWKPLGRELGPRLSAEYNYASGDHAQADGRHTTFDDLFPAGYNKFGFADPYAWRNIRYPAVGVDVPVRRGLTVSAGGRWYWLANRNDGLYPGGDEYVARVEDAGSGRLASQVLVSATYEYSARWRFHGGYGRMFTGPWLREAGLETRMNQWFVGSSFAF